MNTKSSNKALQPTFSRLVSSLSYDKNTATDSQSRFDSHAPDADPFGVPVYVAPLPAGSVR